LGVVALYNDFDMVCRACSGLAWADVSAMLKNSQVWGHDWQQYCVTFFGKNYNGG
jgi:hypothetical protein